MNKDITNLLIIEGTTRPGRQSIKAARLIEKVANENPSINVKFFDPAEVNIKFDGNDTINKIPEYGKLTEWAHAFYIVTPEYNHSFPGTLKKLLDTELANYIHKPVTIAGVSVGIFGGARCIENLLPTLREMGFTTTFTDVNFANINNVFDKDDNLIDKSYLQRINNALTELLWMSNTLRYGRANIDSRYHKKVK